MTQPANAPSNDKSCKPAGKCVWSRLAKAGRWLLRRNSKTAAPVEKDWRPVLTGEEEKACPAAGFRQLSEELRLAGEFFQADAVCSRGVALHPDNLWLALIHAKIADSLDDPVLQMERWRRVIDLGGDKAPARAFKNVADCHQERGEFSEAEAVVRQGMLLFPEDSNLEERLARICHAAGFNAKAIGLWTDLIAHHPAIHSAWVHRRIAEAWCSEGLLDRAAAALEEGLCKYPDDERLKETQARLNSRMGIPLEKISSSSGDFTAHLFQPRAEPFGRGICTLPFALDEANQHVPAMLDFAECIAPFRDSLRAAEVDVFTSWGASTNQPHHLAIGLAKTSGKPHLSLEYGFIGSPDPANDQSPRHSIIVCPGSIYFDTTQPSALEDRLNSEDYQLDDSQRERVAACIAEITRHRITRNHHAPKIDLRGRFPADGTKRVLLVDQRFGDPMVDKGLGGGATFERMWEAALALPDHEVVVALISDPQNSYFGRTLPDPLPPNVTLVDFEVNPFCLFEVVDRVFVCTAHAGFEALLAGREVDCFGVPFYAGWGLTHDRVVSPRRKRRRSLEEIFHLFYIKHSRYFVPGRGVAEIEDLIGHLVETQATGEHEPEPPAPVADIVHEVAAESLRILMILPSPRQGASGRYIQTLAWSLCRLGCEVQVLAEGNSPPIDNGVGWLTLAFDGTQLATPVREAVVAFAPHIVYENGVRSRTQRAALEIMLLTGARLAMQSEDDDVQVFETHHGKEAAEILTLADKPLLTIDEFARYLQSIDLEHSLHVLLDPAYDRWVEPLTRALCYRLSSLHTAIWHPFQERLAREYGTPTMVVPPVASKADYECVPPTPEERKLILKRHGIDPASTIIFIGGALYSYSDEYAVFLDAINRTVESTGAAITLVVTPTRSSLPIGRMARETLHPNVGFVDINLAEEDLYMEMLKVCDIVCSPGLPDTFNRFRLPSRLVKAMAMAKPVLTCRCGFGESLDHGVNGFLMDGTDPSDWANSIALCLDAEKRRQVGAAGRLFAEQHFDSDRVAGQLKAEFAALMAKPVRRLADGFAPTRHRGKSAGTAVVRGTPGTRLRSRYHSTMHDAIHRIAAECIRLDTVVHLGAGVCNEFEDYCRMGAAKIILVEALADQAEALRKLEGYDGRIVAKQAVISGNSGNQTAFITRNSRADNEGHEQLWLLRPSRLLECKPALRIDREISVTTTTLAAVCADIDLSAPNNLLVLELNGIEATALAATPGSLLQGFRWIALRASDPPLCDGGTSPDEVQRILREAGFEPIEVPPNHAEPCALLLFRKA